MVSLGSEPHITNFINSILLTYNDEIASFASKHFKYITFSKYGLRVKYVCNLMNDLSLFMPTNNIEIRAYAVKWKTKSCERHVYI